MIKKEWYKLWGKAPEKILNGSHQYADGTLHNEVRKKNGNVTHLDKLWTYAAGVHHPNPARSNHGLSVIPPKSAIWVDHKGERFGPEPLVAGYDTRFLVENVCKQPIPENK